MTESGYVIVDKETGLYFARNRPKRYTNCLWLASKYQEQEDAQRMLDRIKRSPASYHTDKPKNLMLQLCDPKGWEEKTAEELLTEQQTKELEAFMEEIGQGTALAKIADFCKDPVFIEPLRDLLTEKIEHDTDITIDLLHVIELVPYSKSLSTKLVKFERNQRFDRRKFKDALGLLEILYPKGAVTTTKKKYQQYLKEVAKIETERRMYFVRTPEVMQCFSSLFKEQGGEMYLAMHRPTVKKGSGARWITETRRKVSQLL